MMKSELEYETESRDKDIYCFEKNMEEIKTTDIRLYM